MRFLVRVPRFDPDIWDACRPLDEHERLEAYRRARARVDAQRARAERAGLHDATEPTYETAATCG